MNKINKTPIGTRLAIERRSAAMLPDRPTQAGFKPWEIRNALFSAIIADKGACLMGEIDRIVDEANAAIDALKEKITTAGTITIPVSEWDALMPTKAYVSIQGGEALTRGGLLLVMPGDTATKDECERARVRIDLDLITDQQPPLVDQIVFIRAEERPDIPLNFKYFVLKTESQQGAVVALIGVDAYGGGTASGVDEEAVKALIDKEVPEWARAKQKPTYTPEEVKARPATWTPTAEEIGARPSTWMPTAADVRADSEGTAADEVKDHNEDSGSHTDIRLDITTLRTMLNTVIGTDTGKSMRSVAALVVAEIVGDASDSFDTLEEIAAWIEAHPNDVADMVKRITDLEAAMGGKVSKTDIINTLDSTALDKPLSAAMGAKINAMLTEISNELDGKTTPEQVAKAISDALAGYALKNHDHDGVYAKPADIPTKLSQLTSDSTHRTVTDAEKASWNELAERTPVPDYWETMMQNKAAEVKALQESGGINAVCFAWASDTHIDTVDRDPGTGKGNSGGKSDDIGKLMARIMDDAEVPFAVISGDIATRASMSTEEGYLTRLASVPAALSPLWGTERLLMCLGNHDGVWGEGSASNPSGYYSKRFTQARMWSTFFRGQALDFRRVFSDNGLYFFVDNTTQKVRFIMLNSHFAADKTDGRVVFDTSCYGQDQLDWLADVALDLPEGYGAVIVAHVPPTKAANGADCTVDRQQLIGIINAYINKTTFAGSYTGGVDGWQNSTVSVDFTDAKGEIIAMFTGHIHWDAVDKDTMACPLITIISAGASANTVNAKDGEIPPVRYPWGTDQETSFDVVTINRKEQKIYCTRVGAGASRVVYYGEEEEPEVKTYTVTNTLTNCTTSNNAATVQEGAPYSATITANSGYTLDSVTAMMGSDPVTVTDGSINIASVTGDIVITAMAVEVVIPDEPAEPTNFANPSDANWKTGYRISSSATTAGYVATCTGFAATNIIGPVEVGDIVKVVNFDLTQSDSKVCMCVSATDVTPDGGGVITRITAATTRAENISATTTEATFTCKAAGYWRFSGKLIGTAGDVVINIQRNGEWL